MTDKPSGKQSSPKLHISIKDFILAFWKTITVWIIIGVFVAIALHYEIDKAVIGGVVVIFGLMVATFLTLVVVPVMYSVLEPIKRFLYQITIGWWRRT